MISVKFNFKKCFVVVLSLFMLTFVSELVFTPASQAQPSRKSSVRTVKKGSTVHHRKQFFDARHSHNRAYPVRGHYFRSLPRDHRVIRHGSSRYYSTSHGVWYRPYRGLYEVIAPPIGIFVPFLPLFYTTVRVHGAPYYYANGTYYTQTPGGYVVVHPPQGEVMENPPVTDDEDEGFMDDKLFIYPSKGQSEKQRDLDRYECHQWALEQADYDPTQISSGRSADEVMQGRVEYRRAIAACLESRGYAVK
ncbi:MAG TPA: DUF6515 family protein [Smithella sp.]|jgi:hypothetical protein|nr:hypothetical protein [Smithella sp.]NMC96485.1 hypothetical protein [Deltaproteobacteria bacterium]HNQ64466.1 DUF6515 family protein [Smithella sp.]HOG09585.1 DUF6515 family protein [Smithella sp.]HOO35924.1 DUF6515 family protein [Smithella sp.]